ncbi:UvrD-helicase domain-containing protein [Streptacidiphilus sp. EB103A]|uniref:UvrD-helicase domain-containing protein n=1 Tax=Streptacidiphilus sp. EB103A TaxID=3156275 RepID=UPI003511EDBC
MPDPTPEQQDAIDTYGDGLDMVLQAGAGCGKSSTLKMIGKSDPRRRMLYLAYNKATAADAARSFPTNVVAKTGHGLAFDPRYLPRIQRPRQTALDAAKALGVDRILGFESLPRIITDHGDTKAMSSKVIMRCALDALEGFCHSDDAEVSHKHVKQYDGLSHSPARDQLVALVLPVARAAWKDVLNPDGVLKHTHDYYLKIWALSEPRIESDVILLDEAQDTNDVLAKVLLAQDHAQRIAVGDSAQQIYEWRGAKDALSRFERDLEAEVRMLSQSFRFGPAIATEANRWLHKVGTPLRLTGWDQCASEVGPVEQPDAILCRTNAGAMGIVLEQLAAGRKVALVGGSSEIKRLAWAAEALQGGRPTDHPELLAFSSWDMVRQYAEEEDGSLRVLVKLIDDYGTEDIIAAADSLASEQQAELVVSTAHRSKGREWPSVKIHGDFRAPKPDPKTGLIILRREEARLAYVAVTRARERLDNSALAWIDTVNAVSA